MNTTGNEMRGAKVAGNIVCADRALGIVDVAFQGGRYYEQAASAHEFAAALYRLRLTRGDFGAITVQENDAFFFVRVEGDASTFDKAMRVVVRALAEVK